jgi:hypothetical protein
MGDFFKLWRRKIGVLILGLACLLVMGWVRSFSLTDLAQVEISSQSCVFLESSAQTIGVGMERANERNPPIWSIAPAWETTPSSGIKPLNDIQHFRWNAQWHDFGIGGNYDNYPNNLLLELQAPYWSTVIPLTLLSAYLLFSKPRIA